MHPFFKKLIVVFYISAVHHAGSLTRYNAYFSMGSGPILLSNLYCIGTETSLLDCNRYNMYGTLSCIHRDDAGVICEGMFAS